MVNYKELYLLAKNEQATRAAGGRASKNEDYPNITQVEKIENKIDEISKIELIRNENDLISAKATLEKLKETDSNLFYYILFVSSYPRRSVITDDGPALNALVPVLMGAHKWINNVMYEEWDKSDPAISYAVGVTLYNDIKPFLKRMPILDDNMLKLREPNCFVKSTGLPKKLTGNTYATLKYGEGKQISGSSLALKIKGQFWYANVELRHTNMILNTYDWDDFPDAFDKPSEKLDEVVMSGMIF